MKPFLTKLMSYIKPVPLGIHSTCEPVNSENILQSDDLLKIIEEEVNKAILEKKDQTYTQVYMTEPVLTNLNPNLGDFKILSISVFSKSKGSIVKLKHIKSGKIIKLSMNVFRIFFELKKI